MHDSAIVSFTWQHLLRRFLLSGILVLPLCVRAQDILKINGSTTVNLPVAEAAEILRSERGMSIQLDTQGGSSGGISMLGDGLVQIGMSSKPVGDEDRAKYREVPSARHKSARTPWQWLSHAMCGKAACMR